MKLLLAIILGVLLIGLVPLARAAITNSSRVIPYQGRLTDSSGNNVADGTYSMTFKIYTVSTGGSASFTETNSSVSVSSGLFSVLLGSLSANGVNLDFANPPYYLGITVGANAEMSPRIQLGFAPLAHNSQYLDGTPLSSFQLNTGVLTGAVGTNTRLQATGTGTGSTGNGSIYFLNSSGTTAGRFDTVGPITTSTPVNATGGTVTYSGGYTIHTFTSSGTFTPASAGTVEYLVVGGGGGGGSNAGGGGGGGGFRSGTGFGVTAQAYTITVGGGGAGSTAGGGTGANGGSSTFSTITSSGGGGSPAGGVGISGGSGGGAGAATGLSLSGGSGNSGGYSPSEGNNGGSSAGTGHDAGGGGGAGSAGGNGISNTSGGNGGDGSPSSISGSAVTYAGGGGGGVYVGSVGSGGAGGGGAAGTVGANGTNGTANTGGGGGGGGDGSTTAGNGGSGIVIIRYPTNNYGTFYLGSTNASSADLAEYYVTGDKSLEAGDVVIVDSDSDRDKGVLHKATKSYDSKLVGVISTNPGVVLGSIDGDTGKSDKRQLALSGRVPVKIDPDSEPISVGDFLTSSSKPGFAKKASESGYVIGKALEKWSPSTGSGQIEVFINLIYANAEKRFDNQQLQIDQLRQIVCLDHPENKLCL